MTCASKETLGGKQVTIYLKSIYHPELSVSRVIRYVTKINTIIDKVFIHFINIHITIIKRQKYKNEMCC